MKALPFTIPAVDNQSFLVQEDNLKNFYPYLHRHQEVQICWIKRGKGTLIVEADVVEFRNRDIFVIASNKAHLFKNELDDSGIESVSIFFGLEYPGNSLANVPELRSLFDSFQRLSGFNKLSNEDAPYFENRIKELLSSTLELRMVRFMDILVSLYPILSFEEAGSSPYSERDGDRMKEIMNYTLENLSNEISIAKVAVEIGYTPEAFCRFFKKRTNKTYIQYLNELRINEACRRIVSSQEPNIAKIALECGYNNISHFNRVFKNLKGNSPLRFKRKIEEINN